MNASAVPRALAVVALVVAFAACHSSKSSATDPTPTAPTTASAHPSFAVVLDDTGLKLPDGPTPGGIYRVSFVDHRTHAGAGEDLALQFRPSGPMIVAAQVPAGHSAEVTFLPNLIVQVAANDVVQPVAIDHQLNITPTAGYSTPVT
jgi:hypothetical protein